MSTAGLPSSTTTRPMVRPGMALVMNNFSPVTSKWSPAGDHFEVTGEKLFITNAIPGRTIGLVVVLEGKPAVLIAELPPEENEHFRLKHYGLYALKHAYNNGLLFDRFRVPRGNLLRPPV